MHSARGDIFERRMRQGLRLRWREGGVPSEGRKGGGRSEPEIGSVMRLHSLVVVFEKEKLAAVARCTKSDQRPLLMVASLCHRSGSCQQATSLENMRPEDDKAATPVAHKPRESLSERELAEALSRIHKQLHSTPEEQRGRMYPAIAFACEGVPPELPSTPCKEREETLISFDRCRLYCFMINIYPPAINSMSAQEGGNKNGRGGGNIPKFRFIGRCERCYYSR